MACTVLAALWLFYILICGELDRALLAGISASGSGQLAMLAGDTNSDIPATLTLIF
jgi:hypothetical protein